MSRSSASGPCSPGSRCPSFCLPDGLVGATFFRAGLLNYQWWEFTIKLFQDEYRVPLLDPELAARMAMTQELTIPILLFLGLGTRLATLPLLGMIAVIQAFVYPNAYNDHLTWGAILVLLLTRDPGVWSLDHLIVRQLKPRSGGLVPGRRNATKIAT